ncbi:MAG: hypothetical protein JO316_06395 [Abitibacteriaceae bacterium]|nr:hypothetical protein [Abditibacteriaceae bacterium]MBV9864961.1 hypothetical protein [Abditibacteriaceae bacterium]
MYFIAALLAAVCFTLGGICMKLSQGLTRLWPSLLVFVCFLIGAGLQTVAMRKSQLSVTYILVLGLEAVLALLFGVFIFKESWTVSRTLGLLLIIVGIILLRAES